MVDENKFLKVLNIVKIVVIVAIVMGFIFYFTYTYLNSSNKAKIKRYLLNNGYEAAEDNSYSKFDTSTKDGITTSTTYLYSVNANKFTKEIKIRQEYSNSSFSLLYNGTDTIKINSSNDAYANGEQSTVVHSATYNMKSKKLKCEIEYIENNHPLQCKEIKEKAKEFSNEINLIIKKNKINNLFTTKNSNKW